MTSRTAAIAAAFDRLADITIAQVEQQVADGRVTLIQHCDGTKEVPWGKLITY